MVTLSVVISRVKTIEATAAAITTAAEAVRATTTITAVTTTTITTKQYYYYRLEAAFDGLRWMPGHFLSSVRVPRLNPEPQPAATGVTEFSHILYRDTQWC